MRLRWLTVKNQIDSEVARQFAKDNSLTFEQAVKMLEDATPRPILQYCPSGGTNQDWTNVPHITEFRHYV